MAHKELELIPNIVFDTEIILMVGEHVYKRNYPKRICQLSGCNNTIPVKYTTKKGISYKMPERVKNYIRRKYCSRECSSVARYGNNARYMPESINKKRTSIWVNLDYKEQWLYKFLGLPFKIVEE
jgi:hypothetical protein